jgi:hypothetical protein
MGGPTLAPIVRAVGGDLYAAGRRASIPGPGHGADDRSVSLWLRGGRVIVNSFAGDNWRDVLDDLARQGLVDDDGRLLGAGGPPPGPEPDVLSPGARRRLAAQLWSEARPVAGSLSARHLERRGVAAPSEGLRHHPGVRAAVYAGRGPVRPALLAAIHDAAGDLVGVEVTYLAPDGARAAVALPRKTVGLSPAGAAVRLWPAAPRLLVGEGVFTCLSAQAVFGLPAWALLSTRNVRAWSPPAEVTFVLVAGDRGQDGETAAQHLAGRLRGLGVRTVVRLPPAPFGDWNEAAAAARAVGEGEGGRDRAGAADGRSGPPARRSDP